MQPNRESLITPPPEYSSPPSSTISRFHYYLFIASFVQFFHQQISSLIFIVFVRFPLIQKSNAFEGRIKRDLPKINNSIHLLFVVKFVTNNLRTNQGVAPNMDTSDWRAQLQPDGRQRIVNKIMDTLKKHLPGSGQEGLHELQNMAQRFEEKIFTAATSQYDYLRKISLKMLTMETKSQGTMANNIPLNQVGPSNKPPDPGLFMQYQVHNQWQQHPILFPNQPQSLQQQYLYQEQLYQSQKPLPETSSNSMDSTAQTGQPSGGDWQEEVYRKIKAMKESYLTELSEMYQKIATKLQQHDSLTHQPKSDKIEKLKVFKMMLEHLITFLQVSKSNISPSLKEKLGSYEKQIINFINTIRPRNMSPLQPGQLPPPHMHSMSQTQSQVTQVQLHENQMNNQLQTTNIQGPGATMQQNNMTSMQHSSLSGVSSAQQLISQIQSQLAQLQLGLQQQPESYASTQVNGLKLQVNGLKLQVNGLESEVEKLKTDKASLQEEVVNLKKTNTDLEAANHEYEVKAAVDFAAGFAEAIAQVQVLAPEVDVSEAITPKRSKMAN